MTLAVGSPIPDVAVMTMTEQGIRPVQTAHVLGRGRVVLFAVPGAFTPTCSERHLPGYILHAPDFRARGIGTVACLAVNDAYVMAAWSRDQQVGNRVLMLADGNGDFTREAGLEMDGTAYGLGRRSQRYAAVIEEGTVTALFVETEPGLDVSSAEAVLAAL